MSRRFAITSFIVISSILILSFLFVLMLFLLPGVSFLGIKYIALDTHYKNTGKLVIEDQEGIGNFSGIVVNAYEIPVEVVITGQHTYSVEYFDNYNGITNSKIKDPTISFSMDSEYNAVIDVSEYHTLIYESMTSTRYLRLYLPEAQLKRNPKNLTINSTRSKVKFVMDGDYNYANFVNLTINTNADVDVKCEVEATTFAYKTSQSIEIDEEKNNTIVADNYKLHSTNGKIVVKTPVYGDLNCTTTLGRVLVNSVYGDFTASTTFGDVGYYGSGDGRVNVKGKVNITTKAGNVKLGEVLSENDKNFISTTSGNINIIKINDGDIRTQRGRVEVNSVRNFDVLSTTGTITIQEAKVGLVAKSTRGKIILGGEDMLMNNIDVDSTLGDVIVKSASGVVNINTITADVEFNNLQSKDIEIICGGKLKAEGLKGNVYIEVEEAVESMSFYSVDEGSTEIKLSDKCKEAFIIINASTIDEVTYYVTGSTIDIKEYKDYQWQDLGGSTQNVYSKVTDSPYSFILNSNKSKITLGYYLAI